MDLIILGNGFDLSCGLKSSYYHFFEKRINPSMQDELDKLQEKFQELVFENSSVPTTIDQLPNFKGCPVSTIAFRSVIVDPTTLFTTNTDFSSLTFWDLIFYFSKKDLPDTWNDVESRMLDFLSTEASNRQQLSINHFIQKSYMYARNSVPTNQLSAEALVHLCFSFYDHFIARYGINQSSEEITLLQFLTQERTQFEHAFAAYLKEEIESSTEYTSNARKILTQMITHSNKSIRILSFNYTTPWIQGIGNYRTLNNIHGTLEDDNIIFGVDKLGTDQQSLTYTFTKTYRKLLLAKQTGRILPPRDTVEANHIKIFGHSLSPADYSYFQAIFDYYNIYDSTVSITLFYRVYEGITEEDLKASSINALWNLLTEYGKTMENQSHADNLIHKLMLESRLSIEKLPT